MIIRSRVYEYQSVIQTAESNERKNKQQPKGVGRGMNDAFMNSYSEMAVDHFHIHSYVQSRWMKDTHVDLSE